MVLLRAVTATQHSSSQGSSAGPVDGCLPPALFARLPVLASGTTVHVCVHMYPDAYLGPHAHAPEAVHILALDSSANGHDVPYRCTCQHSGQYLVLWVGCLLINQCTCLRLTCIIIRNVMVYVCIYTHVHTASDLPCMHAYADLGYIKSLYMHACVCM